MDQEYAGESLAKKVARVRLYRRVRAAWKVRGVNQDAWSEQLNPQTKKIKRLLAADTDRAFSHLMALGLALAEARVGNKAGAEAAAHYYQHGAAQVAPLGSHCYRSEHSPMGVVLGLCFEKTATELEKKMLFEFGRDTSSIIKKDPMDDLLAEADSLQKEFSLQQVAEILDVSKGTLAAWRAHRTMGTYSKAG